MKFESMEIKLFIDASIEKKSLIVLAGNPDKKNNNEAYLILNQKIINKHFKNDKADWIPTLNSQTKNHQYFKDISRYFITIDENPNNIIIGSVATVPKLQEQKENNKPSYAQIVSTEKKSPAQNLDNEQNKLYKEIIHKIIHEANMHSRNIFIQPLGLNDGYDTEEAAKLFFEETKELKKGLSICFLISENTKDNKFIGSLNKLASDDLNRVKTLNCEPRCTLEHENSSTDSTKKVKTEVEFSKIPITETKNPVSNQRNPRNGEKNKKRSKAPGRHPTSKVQIDQIDKILNILYNKLDINQSENKYTQLAKKLYEEWSNYNKSNKSQNISTRASALALEIEKEIGVFDESPDWYSFFLNILRQFANLFIMGQKYTLFRPPEFAFMKEAKDELKIINSRKNS